ncbi:MAG: Gingipain R [Bacteroidetes bacterium]|nr:MAG: Gingipain R [Bacteroidota bacterium]
MKICIAGSRRPVKHGLIPSGILFLPSTCLIIRKNLPILEFQKINQMKKTVLFSIAFAWVVSATAQQNEVVVSQNEQVLTVSVDPQYRVGINTKVPGVFNNLVWAEGSVAMLQKGAPELPVFYSSLIIAPVGAVQVTTTYTSYEDIQDISLLPSKGSLKRNINPDDVPYEFGPVYSTNAFFPGNLAEAGTPGIAGKDRRVSVRLFPFQYNPVTKTLRVYHGLQAIVLVDENIPGENEISATVRANEPGDNQVLYTPLGETGRMLVIAPQSYFNDLQPLVDWKKEKGIETDLVDIATVGNTQSAIKTYVQNYYNQYNDLMFLLLVGDHAQVNSYNAGMAGSEIKWSDSEYGQLAGSDKYPEIFVGRMPAASVSEVQRMVSKTLEYEKTPDTGSWYTTSIGIGSDQGAGIGDDGEADWQHLRNIRTLLMGYGYATVHEFYDGSHGGADASGNPNSSMVATAMNTGASLFMYCGHGDQNTCVTSNYSSTDVNAATNNNKYPFVISVACNNGTFTTGTCISEAWMRAYNANGPVGAINATGSSILMAWAEPMEVEDEIANILTEQYGTANIKHTLGGLFYNGEMSMLDAYNNSTTSREVMETWVMFGDPSVMMRTVTPDALTASHLLNIPLGSTSLTVNCNTDGATVCITQAGQILGTGTVSSGTVTINFTALTSTTPLLVTATAFNKIPYQGTVMVDPLGVVQQDIANGLQVYPNPASDVLTVEFFSGNNNTQVDLLNTLGQQLESRSVNGQNSFTKLAFDLSNLEQGVYFVRVNDGQQVSTRRILVK